MKTIKELMHDKPISLPDSATVVEAAKAMRDNDIGAVLVNNGDGSLCGIVTDRDLVVRCLGDGGQDANSLSLGKICTRELSTLDAGTSSEEAVKLMRERAVRRIPVVEGGKPIGILSLGDLAVERDRDSVLGQISAAPPTH